MEGSKGKAYPQQAERGYSTLLLYLDGSDLESSYGAAGDDYPYCGGGRRGKPVAVQPDGGLQLWAVLHDRGRRFGGYGAGNEGYGAGGHLG